MTKTNPAPLYPYSVRRQSSSKYTGLTRYIVVRNPGCKRVYECLPSTELVAWINADRLNVAHLVQKHNCTWNQALDIYLRLRLNPWRSSSLIPHLDARRKAL